MRRAPYQEQVRLLVERAQQMERDIFASPPQDYPAFRERLGAWMENQWMQQQLAEMERGIEKGM